MFQQKLKLAVKNGSEERAFPMHVLIQIFSVWEVYLSRPRALTTLYLCFCLAIPPHLLGTGSQSPG